MFLSSTPPFDVAFLELIKTFGISIMYVTPFLIQTHEINNALKAWKTKERPRCKIYSNYMFYHGCYVGFNILILSSKYFLGYDVLSQFRVTQDVSLYLSLFGGLSLVQLYSNSLVQRIKNCVFVYSIVVPYFIQLL